MQKVKDLNFSILVGGLLFIGTLISLNILILNAEALVALCFILFVIFAYLNFNNIVIDLLNDRTNKIQKDFNYYFELQEEILKSLILYHKKRISLMDEIKEISTFSKSEIKKILIVRQKDLTDIILEEVDQKLKSISIKEVNIIQMIQKETSISFSKSVYSKFNSNKTSSFSKDILLQEGISLINNISNSTSKEMIQINNNNLMYQLVIISKYLNIPMNTLILGTLAKF